MAEERNIINPFLLNMDSAYEKLKPTESPFIKALVWDINANLNQNIGTNNPTNEGQNAYVLSPERGNQIVPNVILPDTGFNKAIGTFESVTTRELYHFNYNSEGNHMIAVLDGNTGLWSKVIIDSQLGFSNDPKAFIAEHRVTLRAVYDSNGNVVEKHLIFTDGFRWQHWINVIAAQRTNGFDASLFPYWTLQPPHFDRRELLEYAPRPPMYKPEIAILPNTPEDINKVNYIADKAFQFCHAFINTDGRVTTSSPFSKPLIVTQTDYLYNQDNMPKKASLTLYAGSPLTEKTVIYAREATVEDGTGSLISPEYSDWFLVETINKFDNCGANDPELIGNDYWLRTNQWANYNYDTVFNTIEYIFDNSRRGEVVDQDTVNRLFNEMPLRSKAESDIEDAVLLANNEYGYPNFGCDIIDNLTAQVAYVINSGCVVPLRQVRLYAYIGRNGHNTDGTYTSQVGYYLGTADPQLRFGGMSIGGDGVDVISLDTNESKYYKLDFADHDNLVCYLKGTSYYAVGKWATVSTDHAIALVEGNYDFTNNDTLVGVNNILVAGQFFVCVFDFIIPAGKYIGTLGRHNTNITEDFRSKSTYLMGIADSLQTSQVSVPSHPPVTSITASAIKTFSKEMEIDCTNSDIDVWGNGQDLFYVYCPVIQPDGQNYRFIEGVLLEQQSSLIPVEYFPYDLINLHEARTNDSGVYTDKNGFYFAYVDSFYARTADIRFTCKLNCTYPTVFTSPTPNYGSGWRPDNIVYLSDHAGHGSEVGDCNRIIWKGKVTNIDGTIPYSNIAISIVGGATAKTDQNGQFELIVHNGMSALRHSNIYINATGNFIITVADCGYLPLYNFNEPACTNCNVRQVLPDLNFGVNIIGTGQTSLKQGGKYSVGIYGADLAGRLMYVNIIDDVYIPSFLERDNTLASFIQVSINNSLDLSNYPDIKWITLTITNDESRIRFVQWVGDKISFIDVNGNVTTDPASAEFCAIYIQSLYDFNVKNNFSTLAKYQFAKGDRLIVYDNGQGQLLDTETYGSVIDIQVLGTNYNQAVINAGLVPPATNTVFNTTAAQTDFTDSVTLIVRYDSRLDKLLTSTGFWIEVYTPAQVSDVYLYNEVAGFYPVINGKIALFTGYINGVPTYNYPVQLDIDFWDIYLIPRSISIPDVGQPSFSHLFESKNVNDSFGANLASGGRQWIKNDNAKQLWYKDDTTKSNDFVNNGLLNGLATFIGGENRKEFKGYKWGGIMAVHAERNIIAFICENDWFITDYNFHYSYANEQGVIVTNLNNGLSEPHQKVGDNYGVLEEHTATVIIYDKMIWWLDANNGGWIRMDYASATDVTVQKGNENGGVQSYFNAKLRAILRWNETHDTEDRFEIISGIDMERENIFVSFRPIRMFSQDLTSFVNDLREINLLFQETLVYKINMHAWTRFTNFVPEYYGKLRGNSANVEMIAFANGIPYLHNNSLNVPFNNFFGIQTTPSLIATLNVEPASQKILQTLAHDCNNSAWFVDIIYSNVENSFSWLSTEQFEKVNNIWFAAILRDANSYPDTNKDELFNRSMLLDGKRMFGFYFLCRFILSNDAAGKYFELKNILYTYTKTGMADN